MGMGAISSNLPPVSSGYFSGMSPRGRFGAKDQVAPDGGEAAVEEADGSAAFPAEAGAREPGREPGKAAPAGEGERRLSREEIRGLEELKQRDRQVHAHEQAHTAIGGPYASAPTYTYRRGPDGALYAVGGEVAIDTSPVRGNPEATLRKAQQVRAAALAPADPSPQDRNVAAQASQMEARARSELAKEPAREGKQEGSGQPPGAAEEGRDVGEGPEATPLPGVGPETSLPFDSTPPGSTQGALPGLSPLTPENEGRAALLGRVASQGERAVAQSQNADRSGLNPPKGVVLRALAQYQFFAREELPVNPRQPATGAAASGVSAPRAPRVADLTV